MTTWMIVYAIGFGYNAGQTIIIEHLPSYAECVRVSTELESVLLEKGNIEWVQRNIHNISKRCIEVKK